MHRKSTLIFTSIVLMLFTIAGIGTLRSYDEKRYTPLDKTFYLSPQEGVWIRPGLNLQILNITIPSDRKPVVTFKIIDDKGQPLDRDGNFTPGVVTTSFVLSYIPADAVQYVSYVTRSVTSPITNVTTNQPTSDSGGRYISVGDGNYTYVFGSSLPENYDKATTHTLGIYATRDLREFGLSRYVANTLQNFVPDGRPVTKIRQVVLTENCNQCHNPLALHGGARQDTRLCVLCHTPQNMDPDTGNTVDFKVMVHKIHMGENLPSAKAGKPYQIIGVRQTVFNFTETTFPRDIRNCDTCHKNAPQGSNWFNNPSAVVCGACHDDVNFKTGDKHPGGPQADDKNCARCHWPEDGEYDSTVKGAHTVPFRSTQLKNPKFEILSVSNTGPGQRPTVEFKITDKEGKPIAPSAMTRVALRLAGPTSDFRWYLLETAGNAAYANGIATYTFTGALPADAAGTYNIGVEGYVNTRINPGTQKEFTYRNAGDNVLKLFAVSGKETPRRVVVELARCNRCHDKLQLHGNSRNNPQYCIGCHNPTMTDGSRRPADKQPGESIHFKFMIHRIHTGEDLINDFTIWGGSPQSFNGVTFPGDRRDCTTCHVGTSYTLPLPSGLLPTTSPRGYWNPTGPIAAACLACHDSVEAAAHAFINTAAFGESCVVCHKEGAEFAVSKVHAR